jgi:hypothetical protein
MLATTRFELLLGRSSRQELDTLAADLGVSAADVLRLGLARMARAHRRKARAKGSTVEPITTDGQPAAAPPIATMDLPALLTLRDELAGKTSVEASRQLHEHGNW